MFWNFMYYALDVKFHFLALAMDLSTGKSTVPFLYVFLLPKGQSHVP